MQNYALIGYPLGHTMSPDIHKRLFSLSGITDFSYEIIEIPPEKLAEEIPRLAALRGYNITIPHKTAIIGHIGRLDESAARYSAVNCVNNENGVFAGYNTDCFGFLKALESENALERLGGRVLLLGYGGAGRMMASEALSRGAALTVAVRDTRKVVPELSAENMIAAGVKVVSLSEIEGEFDVLLNSTPSGMAPNVGECPVSEEVVKNCKLIFDAIYNPNETMLMKMAKKRGIHVIGGMEMLVWQAAAAHGIWNGSRFEHRDIARIIEAMRDILAERSGQHE